MVTIFHKRVAAGLVCGALLSFGGYAKTGAPHTVVADANFTDVAISWSAPEAAKELRWHDNKDYDGDTAESYDSQKSVKTYVAAKFDAVDLKNYVGEKVEAVTFFQYRPVYRATVFVYMNGEIVAQADADQSKFEKNTFQRVELPEAVVIAADAEYMFAVCYEAGSNMDFVAIKDAKSNAPGKGDLMSTDGKNWVATGNGEYLITVNLANDVDEAPVSYNIYRGEQKVNDQPVTETSFQATDQPAGEYTYYVSAVYADGEYKSAPAEVSLVSYDSLLPSPATVLASVSDLDVNLVWAQPVLGGNELTWSDKSDGIAIGGTASSNTKVWVRNQFDASDLIAFRGGKISAINFKFVEAVISSVTLFIMKDGVIDMYQVVDKDVVTAIKAKEWTKFTLKEPYQLEDGHTYAYGIYVMHTPKAHPMGVDSFTTIDVKGNSFSTSSPNSTDFGKSKPSWKTLKSGGMEGNWLMTADIEGAPAAIATPSYDIYRDGILLKSGFTGLSFDDTVENLGRYDYSIVARSGDKSSMPALCSVNVKLPAAYAAPVMEAADFDVSTKKLNMVWNMDKEIAHCGEAAYMAGFDEDMSMMWGAQFSASELAAYKGYSIKKLKFVIGDEIGDFSLGVYTTKGVALAQVDIPAGSVEALSTYTITLPEKVAITGQEDLILAYSGTLPGNTSAIVLDEGPSVNGGAKVSLTGGANWINLSTLNPSYAQYNIYIVAMASEDSATPSKSPSQLVEIGGLTPKASYVVSADLVYGVDGFGETKTEVAAKSASVPTVKSFNIYCNGNKVSEVNGYEYNETIKRFASYNYYVTAVYSNGWESAPSVTYSFNNRIAQKTVAPFGLTGEMNGDDLVLNWNAPENSTVLTYVPEGAVMKALKMTGGTNLTSYCVSKFPAADLVGNVGNAVSHIQFGCGSTAITSAAVIVMFGENIVYHQSVPVASMIVGLNDVRLNEPVVIPANTDVCVGFVMTYKSSAPNPLGCFDCEDAHVGFGDLISSSASAGYWNSLHSKFKVNYCWYIKAILAAPDSELPAKAAARVTSRNTTTYNVYCDGVLVDNVAETTFTVKNAAEGRYYVTAVNGDDESGESNSVVFGKTTGIDDIVSAELSVAFDRASSTIIVGADAVIEVYSMSGALVASGSGSSLSVSDLVPGVYTVKASTAKGAITSKIVK